MHKKVLMVSGPIHPVPPIKGAAVETWMYEVSRKLIGFEPHIASISHPFYPAKEYRDNIFFHRIHFSRAYKRIFQKITRLDPLPYTKRISRIIDEVRPDIVHMHNFIRWCVPIIEISTKKGIRTVLHMHNEAKTTPDISIDALVGCSRFLINHYKNTSIKAVHSQHIYNGVDIERFKPHWEVPHLRQDIRNRLGIKESEFVVLFVGRISIEKGVEHFIKGALLLRDIKNIRFFVIGEIAKKGERKTYADAVMEMAKPLGNKITFTGVFPPSKIHLLYLAGDVIVLPSIFNESFSMVTIEAMASGLPVVVTNKGGVKEYITDGVNGLFINEPCLEDAIVNKIELIMSDTKLKSELGRAGRETVEQRFSWNRIASDVENLYNILI